MKIKLLILAATAMMSTAVFAGTYQCKVYCKGPDGSTSVNVNASSSSQAADIVDPQGHQICRAAGFDRATNGTMSSSQCR